MILLKLFENRYLLLQIIYWLIKNFILFTQNFDLKKKSWIKSGGLVELLIEPESIEDLKKILFYFKNNKIEFYPIGNLSNTLFRDGVIKTPFISLKKIRNSFNFQLNNNYLHLYFCKLSQLMNVLNKNYFSL